MLSSNFNLHIVLCKSIEPPLIFLDFVGKWEIGTAIY